MITNKDIRVENGSLIINGDPYPLDGQSPEAIMEIVEDNSDTTPTENSTAPITSGGVFTALGTKQNTITLDTISNSGDYSCNYTAYKYGKVVYLRVSGVVNATTAQGMELFTLPEGWRPKAQVRAYGSVEMGSMEGSKVTGFNIQTDGKCTTYSYKAFTSGGFSTTYIVD